MRKCTTYSARCDLTPTITEHKSAYRRRPPIYGEAFAYTQICAQAKLRQVIHSCLIAWQILGLARDQESMNIPGINSYQDLRNAGASRRDISRALAAGTLLRISRGWYRSSTTINPEVVSALRVDGRLGCLSGCKLHGLWVPPHTGIHIVFGQGCAPERLQRHMHTTRRPQPHAAVWPLLDCLEHVIHHHPIEYALVVVESAINLKLLTRDELHALLAEHPSRGAVIMKHLDISESGSETRVRLFLQRRNVPVRPQVKIPGIGYVDLLVGRSLILECDSVAHHSTPANYEIDRLRDMAARDLGYDTLRLSYRQIWNQWTSTRRSLIHQIARRNHLIPPRP